MLKISTQIRYGLRALVFLASQQKFCSIKEIAESENMPQAYLEKILLKLKKQDLVEVKRGKLGGFKIKKNTLELPLAKIIKALEENSLKLPCEKELCQKEKNCLSKKIWFQVRKKMLHSLAQINLKELTKTKV